MIASFLRYSPWPLVVFLLVYGPKLGLIDLSVLGPFILISIVSISIYYQRIQFRCIIYILFILIAVISETLLMSSLYGDYELLIIIRNLRALINTITIVVFVQYLYSRSLKYNSKYFINIILAVITIGSFAVLVQVLAPVLQPYFALVTGYNKAFYSLRGFGLTSGFDTAGYLAGFGASIYLMRYLIFGDRKNFILLLINSVAVLFTSRTSIAMFALLSLFVVVYNYKKILFRRLGRLIIMALPLTFIFIIPLVLSTIGNSMNDLFLIQLINEFGLFEFANFSYSYAHTDVSETVADQFYLPSSFMHILFGNGLDADSDVGYIKVIYIGGIFQMLCFALIYFFIPVKLIFNSRNCIANYEIRFAIFSYLIIIYLANLKNLYFLTRGYHEVFVFLLCVLYFEDQRYRAMGRLSERITS